MRSTHTRAPPFFPTNCILFFFEFKPSVGLCVIAVAVHSDFCIPLFNSCCQCFFLMLVKRQIDIAFHNGNHFYVHILCGMDTARAEPCTIFKIIKEYKPACIVCIQRLVFFSVEQIEMLHARKSWFTFMIVICIFIVVDLNYRQFLVRILSFYMQRRKTLCRLQQLKQHFLVLFVRTSPFFDGIECSIKYVLQNYSVQFR